MPLSSLLLVLLQRWLLLALLLVPANDKHGPALVAAHTAEEWKSRSIYQLLTDRFSLPNSSTAPCLDHGTYCGGTYSGVLHHLDYIADLGFSAIWISPVPKNYPRCYHGFSAVDLYSLNPHFGTEAELKALIAECHRRDIWVMVVGNHMSAVGFNYSGLIPFSSASDYHDCSGCDPDCNIDGSAWIPPNVTQIEHCRLESLADLDQDNPWVRQTLLDWIGALIANFSFDGMRVDSVPCVKPQFWREWQHSAGVFGMAEVYSSDVQYVAAFQSVLNSTLSYPLFWTMRDVFAMNQSMRLLPRLFDAYITYFPDSSVLGTFADNHDTPRFLSLTSDPALYLNALTYTFTSLGIPIVYYGTEQGFHGGRDFREPLWTSGFSNSSLYYAHLKQLNAWRKTQRAWSTLQIWLAVADDLLAYTRGPTLVVVSNAGSGSGKRSVVLNGTGLADGAYCSIWEPRDRVTVKLGSVTLQLLDGMPKVYAPAAALSADSSATLSAE